MKIPYYPSLLNEFHSEEEEKGIEVVVFSVLLSSLLRGQNIKRVNTPVMERRRRRRRVMEASPSMSLNEIRDSIYTIMDRDDDTTVSIQFSIHLDHLSSSFIIILHHCLHRMVHLSFSLTVSLSLSMETLQYLSLSVSLLSMSSPL